jgi:hypothetical protein
MHIAIPLREKSKQDWQTRLLQKPHVQRSPQR